MDTADMTWDQHQAWERDWWNDCTNTFSEENKQITYAHRMGLKVIPTYDGRWPVYDLEGKSVLDIGGGPVSMLLKCINRGACLVADPCLYPGWTQARYTAAGLGHALIAGEELTPELVGQQFDEVWIYNVLQHTQNPQQIARNACRLAPVVRVFEWIDTPAEPGHPHTLTQGILEAWFGGAGTMEQMHENGCVGPAWFATLRLTPASPFDAVQQVPEPTLEEKVAALLAQEPSVVAGPAGGVDPAAAAEAAAKIIALVREQQAS